jgi:rhamnosyltransferase
MNQTVAIPLVSMATPRVHAVIVTYHPEPLLVRDVVEAVQSQVTAVHVVDNGSAESTLDALRTMAGVQLHPQMRNLGIGAAQNAGIRVALAAGADFVLLLDQDSLPSPGMVAELLDVHGQLSRQGQRVGALGPLRVAADGSQAGFARLGIGRYREMFPAAGERWCTCDVLIASGSLMPRAALEGAGLMDEGLFIDKVDIEWCLRAARRGYVIAGVPGARLAHRLGDRTVRLWALRWYRLPLHQPFRYYYMVRNSILMQRTPGVGWRWRLADAYQGLQILLFFGLLVRGRGKNLRMMLRGLWDGLHAVNGPLRS